MSDETPEDLQAQPDDRLVAKLREVVADMRFQQFSFSTLMEGILSELQALGQAAKEKRYKRAAASAATIAATASLLYGQALELALAQQLGQLDPSAGPPPWRQDAPTLDPKQACAFDMRKVEQQPKVKAGDWVSLPNGDRVVLRTQPKHVHPETFLGGGGGRIERDHPDLLFYRHRGQLHLAAINGHSIIGLAPELSNISVDMAMDAINYLNKTGQT